MNTIEFRVSGANSGVVAAGLADLMKSKFDVNATVRPAPPPSPPADAGAVRFDPIHAVLLLVEVAIIGFHAYDVFVRQPAEHERLRLVRNWTDVVGWAKTKRPTEIRAIIGANDLLLDESDPERLHHLTEKAVKAVTIIPE